MPHKGSYGGMKPSKAMKVEAMKMHEKKNIGKKKGR